MARRIRGDRAFKRLIKQLPDAVRQAILEQHAATGAEQLSKEQSLVAVRSGAVQSGLSMRILPASLKLKVGLLGKPVNRKLFYGWFIERGRKAGVVIATRAGTLNAQVIAAGGRSNKYKNLALRLGAPGAYRLRITALPPRHFVYTTPAQQLYQPYRTIWVRALARAATGAGND